MFGLIRKFVLVPTLLGIGLLGFSPTSAKASHELYDPVIYQKGSVITLIEPVCTSKDAIIEIQDAIKGSWVKANQIFGKKIKAGICAIDVEVKVGSLFGSTVANKKTERVFFTFEATRTSDNMPVYAIASGTYKDTQ